MPSKVSDALSPRPRMFPSTQMFIAGAVCMVVSLITLAVGFLANFSSPSTTLTVFLVCIVVSVIAAALAGILALVGLFKYRRMMVWNVVLLVASIIFNPLVWLGIIAVTM